MREELLALAFRLGIEKPVEFSDTVLAQKIILKQQEQFDLLVSFLGALAPSSLR